MKNVTQTGPLSGVKKAKGFAAQYEPRTRQEILDHEEANEKKTVAQPRQDKVTALLNDPVYITENTWPFLYVMGPAGKMVQLSVSRFYLNKNFALDMFPEEEPDPKEVAQKLALLTRHGIGYFALTPSVGLANLAARVVG